ncbi:MAG: protein-glutamate O-methyltransferase CheR [Candidatus Cloacimonetes bacterium]|nr:protein-glutamate O-methyltransferase CheR [Candidatus Cloacimonadota bacterium]
MENTGLILDFLKEQRSIDFSGYSHDILARRIRKRFLPTGSSDFAEYLIHLQNHEEELDKLVQVITIKVSHFFRNSLTFEIIKKILQRKLENMTEDHISLRIWSAGCASGEEVYSLAIIIVELLKQSNLQVNIFASDIDQAALKEAKAGIYAFESVKEVKYGLLLKYFTASGDKFMLADSIKKMVTFSRHDLVADRSLVPAESVYGNFDLVLCRNVLIYYNQQYQQLILQKLIQSLAPAGYLVLGDAEIPGDEFRYILNKVSPECKIYRKVQ